MLPRLAVNASSLRLLFALAALAAAGCDTGELPASRTAAGPASPSAAEAPMPPAPTILSAPPPSAASSSSAAMPTAEPPMASPSAPHDHAPKGTP